MLALAHLHTLSLWQTYPRLFIANNKDVRFSSGERVVDSVFDMHNIEASIVALTMCDHTHTAHVSATRCHCDHTRIEANELCDLAGRKINFDCIIDLDRWIRIADPMFQCFVSTWGLNLPKLGPTAESMR